MLCAMYLDDVLQLYKHSSIGKKDAAIGPEDPVCQEYWPLYHGIGDEH